MDPFRPLRATQSGWPDGSEIDRRADLHEARLQHAVRSQPRSSHWREGLVVGQHGIGIGDVVDVKSHRAPSPAKP